LLPESLVRGKPATLNKEEKMFDLSVLDVIISIVVVLLVLSLIVQSIQSLLKKILKLKSSIVLDSMEDLFKYIDTQALVNAAPKQLVADVTAQFKQLGRVSFIKKNPMLDSISKADLQKVLTKLHGDKLKAEVENWFDTVMQGFEERYTRHMKTVALLVSFAVVILLNANFFNIYRNIADSDINRAEILQRGEALVDRLKAQEAPGDQKEQAATPTATPASGADQAAQSNAQIEEIRKETQQYISEYKGLGFTPLRWQQVSDFAGSKGHWAGKTFTQKFMHGLGILVGWSVMALLLSVGAPFWQDTLESLFGLKGLIRKKSQTQNIEEGSGEGQPKP
jgi:hypothetical protein